MVRVALARIVAASLLFASSHATICTTAPAALAATTAALANLGVEEIILSKFLKEDGAAILSACASTDRVDIVALSVAEQSVPGNIDVSVGYKDAAGARTEVRAYTGATCFNEASGTALSFAYKANASPATKFPYIMVTCKDAAGCIAKVDVRAKCVAASTCPAVAGATPTSLIIPNGGSTAVLADKFLKEDGTALLSTCGTGLRAEIVAANILDTSWTTSNIDVSVRYQNLVGDSRTEVKAYTGRSCYSEPAGTTLSFASRADTQPEKTVPVVLVTCKSGAGSCSVRADIRAKCVATSAIACPALTTNAVAVTKTTVMVVDASKFVVAADSTAAVTCAATERIEVASMRIVEISGAAITVDVQYQKDATNPLTVKSFSGSSCFSSSAGLDFPPANADVHPDKVNAVVAISCPVTNAVDCNVKYEVVGRCVPKSTACAAWPVSSYIATISRGAKLEVDPAKFVTATKSALACAANERVSLLSAKIVEITGVSINVDAGYKNVASDRISVMSMKHVTCCEPTALSLPPTLAVTYPAMTIPTIAIECASATSDCRVVYEIVGECVAKSLTWSTNAGNAISITTTTTVAVDATTLQGGRVTYTTTQRVEVVSSKTVETNAAFANAGTECLNGVSQQQLELRVTL